ncbi:MAG: TatD family hydrolase [Firmicutes bacterium]|nr:TatD family hydrolase [Bacillota bacterium]
MFFESHAHYDDERFDADRDALLASLPASGVTKVVNVGTAVGTSRASLILSEKYDFVYASVGVHPHEAGSCSEDVVAELLEYARHPKAVAFGEIGLDYFYGFADREVQRFWFARQLKAAEQAGLPVIIHSRDAAAETFAIIRNSNVRRGVVHCYSGSVETALAYAEMGFFIGVGGIVTFDKARKLPEVVEKLPLGKLLIETDCPYLSPAPFRGKRNTSANLVYIAQKIAEIKRVTVQEAAEATYANAAGMYGIV